jgi:peptidyl-prolyl cis-trans isomerase A (cyclophilin A)
MQMKTLFSRRAWLAGLLAVALPAFAQGGPAPRVELETSAGRIVLELAADKAPKTVANFLAYVKSGFYDGTIFHRVINGFMIQGGGYTSDLQPKPTQPPIPLESRNGLKNDRGTIAMARTSAPDSATSQFFINVVDNDRLNYPSFDGHGYAVFGRVVEGMDVVDRIKEVPTTASGPYQNLPAKPIVIRAAKVITP